MLSKGQNLVKQMYIAPPEEDKRVIDSNMRVELRLKELAQKREEAGTDGFVAGLFAERVELLPEGEAQQQEADPAADLGRASEEAQKLLEQAAVDAQAKITDAQVEAERIRQEARQQAEEEKLQILELAQQQGYEQGYANAQAEADRIRQEYARKERQLEENYQQRIDELEPQFVDMISDIYEHILGAGLGDQREILAHLISGTIRGTEGSHSFIIHVSKEDYAYVNMQKKQILAGAVSEGTTVDVVEDGAVDRNECMIETENGIFDCGLGSQLSELKKRLMLLAFRED